MLKVDDCFKVIRRISCHILNPHHLTSPDPSKGGEKSTDVDLNANLKSPPSGRFRGVKLLKNVALILFHCIGLDF